MANLCSYSFYGHVLNALEIFAEAIDVISLTWSAQESPVCASTYSFGPSTEIILGIKSRLILISIDCWQGLRCLDLPPILPCNGAYGMYVSCICIKIIHTFIVRVSTVLPALNYPSDTCTYSLFQFSLHYDYNPFTYVFQCYLHLFIHQTTVKSSNLAYTHLDQTCSLTVRPSPGIICIILIHWVFHLPPSCRCH